MINNSQKNTSLHSLLLAKDTAVSAFLSSDWDSLTHP